MRRALATALVLLSAALTAGCGGGSDASDVIAYFRDVGDLVPDGQVQVSDVEVGTIDSIELVTEDGVMVAKVEMTLDEGAQVPAHGLDAVIRQTSLLGEQFVELVPTGEGPPFVGAEPVTIPVERTDRRVDVETFLADLSAFVGGGGLEDLNRFTHAQALILEDRGERFGRTIEELATLTDTLADRRNDIGASIDHLAAAGTTLANNKETLDAFLDSLEDANSLLAEQAPNFRRLFVSLSRFGRVNARFLAEHEQAINRNFKALRPILGGLADAHNELRTDLSQLATFTKLFPNSFGGGPGDRGFGDYIQVDAILCEQLARCQTKGEKGDVPGEGS